MLASQGADSLVLTNSAAGLAQALWTCRANVDNAARTKKERQTGQRQMDKRAVALKLVLDRLGTTDISTVEDRMEVQKAVYLTQSAGVGLGYSYGWYVRGPYSPSLTRDYFDLSEDAPASASLKEAAAERIDRVITLMNEPIGDLRRPQRLELLASIHYLLKQSKMAEATARKRINDLKPHVAKHFTQGLQKLREHAFV